MNNGSKEAETLHKANDQLQVKGVPVRRKRRSKRKSSKLKQYFEIVIWSLVVAGFFYVIYLLLSSAGLNVKDSKKRVDISNVTISKNIRS